MSVNRNRDQIYEAKSKTFKTGKINSFIEFGWLRECEGMLGLSLKANVFYLFETRAALLWNESAEHLEERLPLFGHNVGLDVRCTFLENSPSSDEDDRVKKSIAQLALHDAWIATVVTCLTERRRQGGHQQKIYTDTNAFYTTPAIRQLVRRVGLFLKA